MVENLEPPIPIDRPEPGQNIDKEVAEVGVEDAAVEIDVLVRKDRSQVGYCL